MPVRRPTERPFRQRPWSASALSTSHRVQRLKAIPDLAQFQNRNIERVAISQRVAAADSPVDRIFGRPAARRLAMSQPVYAAQKATGRNASGLEGLHSIPRHGRGVLSGAVCTLDRVGVVRPVSKRVFKWHPCHDFASLRVRCRWWGWDRRAPTPTQRRGSNPRPRARVIAKLQ